VRREGTSYAHPLIVLVAHPQERQSGGETLRVGVVAGKSVGTAVERNYAKRRMREAIRPLLPYIISGWDVIFLARRPQQQADFQKLQAAIKTLLSRAKLLKEA
jgi:ribonuclease P protein component